MWIVRLALRRPYTFIVASILIVILGVFAIERTPTDIFPNIGIPVIAVKENKNLMKNDLAKLPWRPGQFITVENYWEAAGVIAAMR